MPSYTPATRADLVPGAVFVVRDVERWQTENGIANGDRLVLTKDDGTEIPYFDKEGGAGRRLCFALEQLERIHPPTADTVAIPREVARALLASARRMKQRIPEWEDAAKWRHPETGLTMQEAALAEADAALAVVREALREPDDKMLAAASHEDHQHFAWGNAHGAPFEALWAAGIAASPLSEGNGDG